MNGNPEYEQMPPGDQDSSSLASDVPSITVSQADRGEGDSQHDDKDKCLTLLLNSDDIPMLYLLRRVCKSFLLTGLF